MHTSVLAIAITLAVSSGVTACEERPALPMHDVRVAASHIQEACLGAYPSELMEELADGETRITLRMDRYRPLQGLFLKRPVDRERGIFYPARIGSLIPVLQRHVRPGVRFLDLGSGDGRMVFLANVMGAHAVGIEYDESLVELSGRAQQALRGLLAPDRLSILRGDFFEHSWSGYDVVYYYDQGSFEQKRLRQKLRADLSGGTILIVFRPRDPFEGFETVTRHPEVLVLRRSPDAAAPQK